jgi:hypothetical protein
MKETIEFISDQSKELAAYVQEVEHRIQTQDLHIYPSSLSFMHQIHPKLPENQPFPCLEVNLG